MLARSALRSSARLLRGGGHSDKVSVWGPIHFERVNWTGNGALPFSVRNRGAFLTVFWTVAGIAFLLPFYGVERKVWPQRVAKWEAAKAAAAAQE